MGHWDSAIICIDYFVDKICNTCECIINDWWCILFETRQPHSYWVSSCRVDFGFSGLVDFSGSLDFSRLVSLLGLNLEHGANHSLSSGLKRRVALVCGWIAEHNTTFVCLCLYCHLYYYLCLCLCLEQQAAGGPCLRGDNCIQYTCSVKMKSASRSLHTIRHWNPIYSIWSQCMLQCRIAAYRQELW